MNTLTKKTSILILTLTMGLLFAGIAYAAQTNFTLFGEAELVSPGNSSPTAANLTSDTDPGFAGVRFEIPEGIPFADLTELSTD